MSSALPLLLADAPAPMFGNAWLALGAALLGVAVLMVAVIFVGRWLAATHPDPVVVETVAPAGALPTTAAPMASSNSELAAVISSSVVVALGERAKIVAVKPITPAKPPAPSVEMLMQQWSIEGRRQIYSSHQVR
ncbi:MAG: hypothetical protein NVV63_14425 [Opitutus sp.]|nr:hypothetical protein [Opitutus sp.]